VATLTTPYDENGLPETPSLTAYYFGGMYEVTGSDVRKYYSFGGQTVAMEDGTGLQYFVTDHLGSIVAVTDSNGTLTSQQRYLPFGGVRENVGNISQTDYGYTGQRNLDSGIGLMDYKARFYSPYLNRFIQPDSIVPDPTNPQSLNRFSYVRNNPLTFIDPTGHWECSFDPDECAFLQNNNPGGGITITLSNSSSSSSSSGGGGNGNSGLPGGTSNNSGCGYHHCPDSTIDLLDAYQLGWQNFGQAWDIYSNPNATLGQRSLAGVYMAVWIDGHIVLVAGTALLLRESVIIIGANLAAQNPNGTMVSIGNFGNGVNGYVEKGVERGYTYFNLGRWWGPLNKVGLADPINRRFMQNQINQGKDVITTIITKPGPGTLMEMRMLSQSGYAKVGEFFLHPLISPIP
jgi:RHS repeat-associated protein